MVDSWIFAVLTIILLELMWIGSRLEPTTPKEEALNAIKKMREDLEEMREDLHWFRDDNFAGHLFKEIQEAGKQLQDEMKEIEKQLRWYDGNSSVTSSPKSLIQ